MNQNLQKITVKLKFGPDISKTLNNHHEKAEIWSRYLQDREESSKNAPAVSGGERLTFIISKNISILSRKKLKRGRSKATSR